MARPGAVARITASGGVVSHDSPANGWSARQLPAGQFRVAQSAACEDGCARSLGLHDYPVSCSR
jgi:hypothetical protein